MNKQMATAWELQELFKFINVDEQISGGSEKHADTKFEVVNKSDGKPEVQVFYPVYTRPILSRFEYEGAITELANYLNSKDSVGQDCEINTLINPAELAFRLIQQKKFDVTIVRNKGAEKVTFSVLKRNPLWDQRVEEYFKIKNASLKEELYDSIKKADSKN